MNKNRLERFETRVRKLKKELRTITTAYVRLEERVSTLNDDLLELVDAVREANQLSATQEPSYKSLVDIVLPLEEDK